MNETINEKNNTVQNQQNELNQLADTLKSSSLYSKYLSGFEQSISTQIGGKLKELHNLIELANRVMQMLTEAETIATRIEQLERNLASMSITPKYPEEMPQEAIDAANAARAKSMESIRNNIQKLKQQYEEMMQAARNLAASVS